MAEKGKQVMSEAASAPAIEEIEALIETNVQRTLDSLDAWKMVLPITKQQREAKAAPEKEKPLCTKEKHTCDMDSDDISALCIGCLLYQRIVKRRTLFQIGGRSDACDFLALQIADPLIGTFIADSRWLQPARDLTGCWFVKHPVSFTTHTMRAIFPVPQASVRRDRVRLWRASDVLNQLGIDAEHHDTVLKHLRVEWSTASGDGHFYAIDELLDALGGVTQIAAGLTKLGLVDAAHANLPKLIAGAHVINREARA